MDSTFQTTSNPLKDAKTPTQGQVLSHENTVHI
jgi:hypothetical protein